MSSEKRQRQMTQDAKVGSPPSPPDNIKREKSPSPTPSQVELWTAEARAAEEEELRMAVVFSDSELTDVERDQGYSRTPSEVDRWTAEEEELKRMAVFSSDSELPADERDQGYSPTPSQVERWHAEARAAEEEEEEELRMAVVFSDSELPADERDQSPSPTPSQVELWTAEARAAEEEELKRMAVFSSDSELTAVERDQGYSPTTSELERWAADEEDLKRMALFSSDSEFTDVERDQGYSPTPSQVERWTAEEEEAVIVFSSGSDSDWPGCTIKTAKSPSPEREKKRKKKLVMRISSSGSDSEQPAVKRKTPSPTASRKERQAAEATAEASEQTYRPQQPSTTGLVIEGEEVLTSTTCVRKERAETCVESLCLPEQWKRTLPSEQQEWLSQALFTRGRTGKAVLQKNLKLWYHPPSADHLWTQPPASPGPFFLRPFFLWVPYRMFGLKLSCPSCQQKMSGAGLYKTVRKVLSSDGWYYMGTEYLECRGCKRKLASWCGDILKQLSVNYQRMFPAVLTYRLCCDKLLLAQMRGRTLGNSVGRLRSFLLEQHTAAWMDCVQNYLSTYKQFQVPGVVLPPPPPLPPMTPVPSSQWLLSVYAMDVHSRKDELLAKATSIFGTILKIDSTKKVTKKLAGRAAGTAGWCTNVGNEHGQVLMSVLTVEKGQWLQRMAAGLMRRYREARVAPPKVLYVDHDCCSAQGRTAIKSLFGEWQHLTVCLDIWHFIQRFTMGVTSESHLLYAPFMRHLSHAIFEWSKEDLDCLKTAKEAEEPGSWIRVSLKELARHCRRRTRGAQETESAIEETLSRYWDVKDTKGIPLINPAQMQHVWDMQRKHTTCIQDPPGVTLYTQTGQITKGGVVLPILRCARGMTSLKTFHLHLNGFIPGTSVCAAYYNLYLLEGITRWNEDRGREAVRNPDHNLRCYRPRLQQALNQLTQEFYGVTLVEDYTQAREYTGELIGMDYLLAQSNSGPDQVDQNLGGDPDRPDSIPLEEEDEDEEEEESPLANEGFGDELLYNIAAIHSGSLDPEANPAQQVPASTESNKPGLADDEEGFKSLLRLVDSLVELRHQAFITHTKAKEITALWDQIPARDKEPIDFPAWHKDKLLTGKVGVFSLRRHNSRPAQRPSTSRLVEAICVRLCQAHPEGNRRSNHWQAVLNDYRIIREKVLSNNYIMQATQMELFSISQWSLTQWYNHRGKQVEQQIVKLCVQATVVPMEGPGQPPQPRQLLEASQTPANPLVSKDPQNIRGLGIMKQQSQEARPPFPPSAAASTSSNVGSHQQAPCVSGPPPLIYFVHAPTPSPLPVTIPAQPTGQHAAPTQTIRFILPALVLTSPQGREAEKQGVELRPKKRATFPVRCSHCSLPRNAQYSHSRRPDRSWVCPVKESGLTVEQWLQNRRTEGGEPS